jgi:hypothetical protein
MVSYRTPMDLVESTLDGSPIPTPMDLVELICLRVTSLVVEHVDLSLVAEH